jgi:hypothetical protein
MVFYVLRGRKWHASAGDASEIAPQFNRALKCAKREKRQSQLASARFVTNALALPNENNSKHSLLMRAVFEPVKTRDIFACWNLLFCVSVNQHS